MTAARDVCALCAPGVASGFALAGVPTRVAMSRSEAEVLLDSLMKDPSIAVVLVQESLIDEPRIAALGSTRVAPLLVAFPAPAVSGAQTAESYVAEILRRSIGYRVRLGA
jgi:vacuolar-type H+-ATPase subunit F/Vma7